jgi:hypothetical protein
VTNVDVFMEAFRSAGILPSVDPPAFNQHGGAIPLDFQLEVHGPEQVDYWLTTDGSDPRLPGGSVNPMAILYAAPISLGQGAIVKARALRDDEWSAVSQAEFIAATVHQPGDANRDGRFNQVDIVLVLQAAKYMTARTANWGEGDWNGDGLFDPLDIVLALQNGDFAAEPLPRA